LERNSARNVLVRAIERERLANMRATEWEEAAEAARSATPAIPDIPSIIRRSTWRTPELRESAARLVANILRKDDDECPPQPPDHFPVS
jgi:hypothetical protein